MRYVSAKDNMLHAMLCCQNTPKSTKTRREIIRQVINLNEPLIKYSLIKQTNKVCFIVGHVQVCVCVVYKQAKKGGRLINDGCDLQMYTSKWELFLAGGYPDKDAGNRI